MTGEGAAARAGEHVAEGIIAKVARSTLRDAVGPTGRAVERDAARAGAREASTAVPGAALSDAERAAARDGLTGARHAGNSTADDFAREFPDLGHQTNPGYATGAPEYTQNCQSCVVAVDKSLEGEPTQAVARRLNPERTAFADDPDFAWPASVESQVGRGNTVHAVHGYEDIAHEMLQGGDGARGVVHGMRLDANGNYTSGHVFNVVNKGGTLHFLDGQTNGYWRRELFQGYQFIRTK